MATMRFPADFSAFLRLLADHEVEYPLVGGYAVAYHGYPRATQDLDVWIARHPANAERMAAALKDFGFDDPEVTPELFLDPDRLVRIGVPPLQLEILTSVSGLTFEQCATRAEHTEVDGVPARFISLRDLRINRRAAGRTKDLADLEELPDA